MGTTERMFITEVIMNELEEGKKYIFADMVIIKCYRNWLKRAARHAEDIPFENRHFELYKRFFTL